ncbi:MAG: AEC family transporter [Candidatus Parabeggiatoa sp. nov. 3]|nr:MAG: AEC family transporter [Gammaproteobacteria bacterium]RKZ65390.1 MAG: AEC family transporter [Gammaproteobacteria bacterium]RKZ89221.1 MAG: AEC family transporter [Gammaproteobacteria bacterium]
MLIARIYSVLFPILTIVIVGYLYARIRPIDMSTANRLNMEVFTPALLFTVLSDNTFNIMDYQQLALATILMILGSGIIVFPLIRWLGINPKTFMPSMMFVNAGNMGIPVALFAFGEVGLPAAMLFLMTTALLNFTLGISLVSQRASLIALLKMPLIQATLLGLLISLSSIEVPSLLITPIKMLGTCAIPVMLLSLGVRLSDIDLTHWRIGLLGAVLRPLSGGLMFLIIRPWFTLTPLQTSGLLIFAMLPPAVVNYIIAEQYQQEPQKVAAIVMLGNVASFISLPIALAFIYQ